MEIYVYLSLLSSILIGIKNYFKIEKKNASKVLFAFLLLCIFFISALRSPNVGADTSMYMYYFDIIKSTSLNNLPNFMETLESGYIYLNKIISYLFSNSQWIIVINSLLVVVSLDIFLKKESQDILLSLFLFIVLGFFQSSMNTSRSTYAILFAYHSLSLFKNKKKWLGIIEFLLAILLHKSVIILLLIPIFENLKITKSNFKIYIFIIVLLYLSFDKLIPIMEYIVSGSYSFYMERADEGVLNKILPLLVHLFFFISIYFSIDQKNKALRENKTSIIYLFFEVLFYLFSVKMVMFTRVAYIFSTYTILSIPNFLGSIESKNKRFFIVLMIVVVGLLQFIIRLNVNNIGNTIPYETIIS